MRRTKIRLAAVGTKQIVEVNDIILMWNLNEINELPYDAGNRNKQYT